MQKMGEDYVLQVCVHVGDSLEMLAMACVWQQLCVKFYHGSMCPKFGKLHGTACAFDPTDGPCKLCLLCRLQLIHDINAAPAMQCQASYQQDC